MDATTHAQPLADRPTNTHLANVNVNSDLKTDLKSTDLSSMEYHRQMLQDKLDNGEKWVPIPALAVIITTDWAEPDANNRLRQPTSYVSPSDDIMSPCSKKLSDIKGKRFKKYVDLLCPS